MKNYNWRTKLKMNKSFIKRLITKIRNKKNKNLNWNTKDEEDRHVLLREEKKKRMIISDKLLILHHHPSHQEEESVVALLRT